MRVYELGHFVAGVSRGRDSREKVDRPTDQLGEATHRPTDQIATHNRPNGKTNKQTKRPNRGSNTQQNQQTDEKSEKRRTN